MVDSRQKGARAEAALKKLLRYKTELNFQRTPGSGALNETHKLKGDLYIPNEKNRFCIEAKHYKDDHLTSKVLTSNNPQLLQWWSQATRQADQVEMQPLLFFKFDRSKWFAMAKKYDIIKQESSRGFPGKHFLMYIEGYLVMICLAEELINSVGKEWIL